MIDVKEVNDIYELDSYRLTWKSLLPQTPGASFFHSLEWLEIYWRHFQDGQRLRVLIVCRDGRPLGILPLVVRTESTRVGQVRVLTYPLHGWGTFYGPIGPNPTATLAAGLRHIRDTPRDFDFLDLRWVDLHGCDRGRTETALEQAGFEPQRQAWDRAAVIDLDGTWSEYWASRSKNCRKKVRRALRRLAARGKVRHVRYRPPGIAHGDGDPRYDLFDACVRIARRSWQGTSTSGTTMCHESVRDFLRETHAAAARAGALDLNLLLLDGRPIAFAYNYHYDGQVYGLRAGFDREFAAFSPGAVLDCLQLEDSFQRGDERYDMGVGYFNAKQNWMTSTVTSYQVSHFPKTGARAQLLRMKRWLRGKLYGRQRLACAPTA